ncbi:hypothetical protein BV20DRAFT_1057248 [Pilatotrama ljubarskyi]|nr:hypothetical protein BV20DRAFT_1057248 [Pilatotrama ljubarskyi]
MEFIPLRPPEEWATGGEPMTEKQEDTSWRQSRRFGIEIPFLSQPDSNGQNVTKAEA